MPHKRAKRSIREAETKKKGYNLVPGSVHDDAPRSAMRIINSLSVQAKFREGGKRTSEDTGERKPKKAKNGDPSTDAGPSVKVDKGKAKAVDAPVIPSIMPHESLGEYNRRIESLLRPRVSQAIKAANQRKSQEVKAVQQEKIEKRRAAKLAKNGGTQEGDAAVPATIPGETSKPAKKANKVHDVNDQERTFKSAPGPRRLNDIAQAPPSLPSLRHVGPNGKSQSVWASKGAGKSGLSAAQERILGEERTRVIERYREIKAGKEAERAAEREAEAKKGQGKGQKRKAREEEE